MASHSIFNRQQRSHRGCPIRGSPLLYQVPIVDLNKIGHSVELIELLIHPSSAIRTKLRVYGEVDPLVAIRRSPTGCQPNLGLHHSQASTNHNHSILRAVIQWAWPWTRCTLLLDTLVGHLAVAPSRSPNNTLSTLLWSSTTPVGFLSSHFSPTVASTTSSTCKKTESRKCVKRGGETRTSTVGTCKAGSTESVLSPIAERSSPESRSLTAGQEMKMVAS